MDLPLSRLQQIVSTINIRKLNKDRERKLEVSWAVRTIAQFVAAGYMTEDTTGLDHANQLSIEEIERELMEADLPEPPPELKSGGFETLLRAFGGRPT